MLLAVDVGNTHTVLGVFREDRLVHTWRLPTVRSATVDQTAMDFAGLAAHRGLPLGSFEALVVGSVVPVLRQVWLEVARTYLACPSVAIGPDVVGGLHVDVDRPGEVGADRLADAVGCWQLHGAPAIVVDCGTAIKVDAVGRGGRFLGGAIAPGIGISYEALVDRAAQLARFDLTLPERALGKHTDAALRSGVIFGFAGLVDALVDRIAAEMGGAGPVVATGGWAQSIAGASRTITTVDPLLTLQGLRLIYAWWRTSAGAGAG